MCFYLCNLPVDEFQNYQSLGDAVLDSDDEDEDEDDSDAEDIDLENPKKKVKK
jgi:hypothetical protein